MNKYLDCYIRVSTTEQKKTGSSLVVQQETGEKVAHLLGLKFRLRDEGARSSTIQYREVLAQIQEDIKKGLVKHIWCIDRDRLFRDMTDSLLFRRDYLEKFNVTLYGGEHGTEVKFDSADEMLTYDLLSRIAQYENDVRKVRSQRGKISKLEKAVATNKSMFMGGTALFGYENVEKEWRIKKSEEQWVKTIFNLYESGESTKAIKDTLDKAGVETKRTKSGLWNMVTIQKMLANESYTGIHKVRIKSTEKTYSFKVPAIISVSQFKKVQKIIEINRKHSTNARKHDSLLDGLLFCECGLRMASHHQKYTKKTGQVVDQKKYFCRAKEKAWSHSRTSDCKNTKALKMDETDAFILSTVKQVAKNSSLLKEKTKKAAMKEKQQLEQNYVEEKQKIEKKIQRIQRELEEVENLMAEVEFETAMGKKAVSVADKVMRLYEQKHKMQSDELRNSEQTLAELDENLVWVDWIGRFSEELDVRTNKFADKKQFIKGLVDKVVVSAEFGENRDKVVKQQGHSFKLNFNLALVNDHIVYEKDSDKRAGYRVKAGKKSYITDMVYDVTARSGSYKRKKKQ